MEQPSGKRTCFCFRCGLCKRRTFSWWFPQLLEETPSAPFRHHNWQSFPRVLLCERKHSHVEFGAPGSVSLTPRGFTGQAVLPRGTDLPSILPANSLSRNPSQISTWKPLHSFQQINKRALRCWQSKPAKPCPNLHPPLPGKGWLGKALRKRKTNQVSVSPRGELRTST